MLLYRSRLASLLGGIALVLNAIDVSVKSSAEDWLRFRGPNGTGISKDSTATPVKWSDTENLKWKSELPGAGVSCPIIVGDKVFVTCYSGYGLDAREPGDQKNLKRHLVCIDRESGKVSWNKTADAILPEDPYSGSGVPQHGYASHTPVSDGTHVYVFFGKSGALAFDMQGNQLWQTDVGTGSDERHWGSASSPILYQNLLIVPAIAESESMVALDTKTGELVWRQEAGGFRGSWSTPILVKVDDGRTDLVIGVPDEIWGLNPDNGKLRWYCTGIATDQFNSSLVVADGVIYGVAGRRGGSIAVKVGGKGDVTETHVVWTGRHRGRFAAPLIFNDRLFHISDGIAMAIEPKTGEQIKQVRLESDAPPEPRSEQDESRSGGRPTMSGGDFGIPGFRGGRNRRGFGSMDYSSPVVADSKIYFFKRNGEGYVFSADDNLEQLAVNRVTADREEFSATPALSNGQIFIRSNKHLYCIAQQSSE